MCIHTSVSDCHIYKDEIRRPKYLNVKKQYRGYLTNKSTNSMKQNLSREASRTSDSQETPRIVKNPKLHYQIHKSQPPFYILSQMNPLQAPHSISYGLTLILSSSPCLVLPSGLFPSGFSTKTPHAPYLSIYMLHSQPITQFLI
jgi:hypothetical protein